MKEIKPLAPCPFCGSDARVTKDQWVFCCGCPASMQSPTAWNRRTIVYPEKKECPYHNIETSKVNCGACRDARTANETIDEFKKLNGGSNE